MNLYIILIILLFCFISAGAILLHLSRSKKTPKLIFLVTLFVLVGIMLALIVFICVKVLMSKEPITFPEDKENV